MRRGSRAKGLEQEWPRQKERLCRDPEAWAHWLLCEDQKEEQCDWS